MEILNRVQQVKRQFHHWLVNEYWYEERGVPKKFTEGSADAYIIYMDYAAKVFNCLEPNLWITASSGIIAGQSIAIEHTKSYLKLKGDAQGNIKSALRAFGKFLAATSC